MDCCHQAMVTLIIWQGMVTLISWITIHQHTIHFHQVGKLYQHLAIAVPHITQINTAAEQLK